MGGSGSKSKGFWPFSGSSSGDDPAKDGNEQTLSRFKSFQGATPFVFTRRSSMFFDEDGDLAHEFYEETIVTKNGRKKPNSNEFKRISRLRYRYIITRISPCIFGIIKLEHPCIHVDFPIVICEA
uniref:Tumor suppressor 2, mitochondrial calcium regulator b n=1 Tax=Neogobius melanostomus TaxID=47308 RepID=A0A8C6WNK1_9GOBI